MKSPDTTKNLKVYEEKLAQMIEALAQQIVAGAQARVYRNLKSPKGTSALAKSLQVTKAADGGLQISTDKPYARYVEFGTISQSARPFLTPAVEEVKVTFSGIMAQFIT